MKCKRILSLALALCMAFGSVALMPENTFTKSTIMSASAAESEGDYKYDILEDGTVEILKYRGNSTTVTIPSKLGGKDVTSIGYQAFSSSNITSVTIPYGVTQISTRAFAYCRDLKKVIIPNSVKTIWLQAFSECSNLTAVSLPDSLKTIEDLAFEKCSKLKTVKFGKNIDDIKSEVFEGTRWLEDQRAENPLVIVNNIIIDGQTYKKSSLVIPEGVKTVGAYSFKENTSIESVKFPSSLMNIDYQAFNYCSNLKSFSFSSGCKLKTISCYAFHKCYNLSYSDIPSTVEYIGLGAFENTKWLSCLCSSSNSIAVVNGILIDTKRYSGTHLNIPDTVHTIGGGAFTNNDSIRTVTIPNSVKTISEDAFSDCNLTTIDIPDSVEYIDQEAINDCPELKTVNIGSGVKKINLDNFGNFNYDDKLTSINVSKNNKVYSSVNGVLYDKQKKTLLVCPSGKDKITIPNSVIKIDNNAFRSCEKITEINIPEGLSGLMNGCLDYFYSLRTINIDQNNKEYTSVDGVVYNKEKTRLLYCPNGKKKVTIPNGVKSIRCDAFITCSSIENILIPKSVTQIDEDEFPSGSNLRIHCYKGSYAEKYANKKKLTCVLIPTPLPNQTRFAGANRYDTAALISKGMYSKGTDTVIVATGLDFHDALVAVPLANAYKAPLLLTTDKQVTKQTEAELARLKAKNVIIVSTNGAVGSAVKTALAKYNPTLITGKTCFETASNVAKALQTKTKKAPDTIFFATDSAFADALSASPVAAIKNAPIIYLNNKSIDKATADYLKSVKGKVKNAYIIGGDGVISDAMMNKVATALGLTVNKTVVRVAGKNRYETCVNVNKKFKSVLSSNSICVAKGLDFPDALAGGVYAAKNGQALFLADGKKLQDFQSTYLKSKNASKLTIFGGLGAVPDNLVKLIAEASV